MQIEEIKRVYNGANIKWSVHCLERMQERDISRADVINCLLHGEVIEDYPDDFPYPSCLVFGYTVNGMVLHIVVGNDGENIYIITAYYPSTIKVEDDLKTRKGR